jgi:hypothetical protein
MRIARGITLTLGKPYHVSDTVCYVDVGIKVARWKKLLLILKTVRISRA